LFFEEHGVLWDTSMSLFSSVVAPDNS
jgi:hypothetical protein